MAGIIVHSYWNWRVSI